MDNPWIIIGVCAVIVIAAVIFGVQAARLKRSGLGKVMEVYSNVLYNERLVGRFAYKGMNQRFRTRAWDDYKHELGFLPADKLDSLGKLFDRIHTTNDAISDTVELRGETSLYRVNVDVLKDPLRETRQYLDNWIKTNRTNTEVAPKRLGFPGF